MVSFRPHKIAIIFPAEGHYDSNGDWIAKEEKSGEKIHCRYEPNGAAKQIVLPDGTAYTYSYLVYLDNTVDEHFVRYGQQVELFGTNGESMGKYVVKGFHKGQLDAKIWL